MTFSIASVTISITVFIGLVRKGDPTVEGEALTFVDAFISVEEVLEVKVWILDGADFILVIDEVTEILVLDM